MHSKVKGNKESCAIQSEENQNSKNEVSMQMVSAKSTTILYPAKAPAPADCSRVVQSSASESISSFSPPSTAHSAAAANVASSNDEDYDKRLRQSITLTWKIPGEYRVSENVSKLYHKSRKIISDKRINSGSDDCESDNKRSNSVKYQENNYPRLKNIASSKSGGRRQKYRLSLHETRSIKEVDRVRSILKNLSGNSKCPHDCDCFDCYTLNMAEESSSDSSCREEIDSVGIIGGANYGRRMDRFKATEQRRNQRLARFYRAEQGDNIIQAEVETENQRTINSERFQAIEPLPNFVYDFEIFLENVRKESIFYDGIIKICRSILVLWRFLLLKINLTKKTRVNPHPLDDRMSSDFVAVDIDPLSK